MLRTEVEGSAPKGGEPFLLPSTLTLASPAEGPVAEHSFADAGGGASGLSL